MIQKRWIPMEVTTTIFGVALIYRIPFSFLLAPVSFALYMLSMDLTPMLFANKNWGWSERRKISAIFGLDMLIVAWLLDDPTYAADYSFWLYLFGAVAFIGGSFDLMLQKNLVRHSTLKLHSFASFMLPYVLTSIARRLARPFSCAPRLRFCTTESCLSVWD
jgi:hypothetical protein